METDNRNYTDFELALKMMGYRRPDPARDPNRWVKPIGYSVFIAHVKELRLNCHFVAANGEFHCWKSEILEINVPNDPLDLQISTFEQYADCRGFYNPRSWGFLTTEQRNEILLGL